MAPADWEFETPLWQTGQLVAGVDEAGRGPLAGPVVAAAVIFPPGCTIDCFDDSKSLCASRREKCLEIIRQHALAVAWAVVDSTVIDRRGLLPATFQAMLEAVAGLELQPDVVLVDGPLLPRQITLPARAIIHGDVKCASIAAASIVAKVTRDRLMCQLHQQYPQYGFAQHKGYGTKLHLAALAQHGPCPLHRRSFAPVRECLGPVK